MVIPNSSKPAETLWTLISSHVNAMNTSVLSSPQVYSYTWPSIVTFLFKKLPGTAPSHASSIRSRSTSRSCLYRTKLIVSRSQNMAYMLELIIPPTNRLGSSVVEHPACTSWGSRGFDHRSGLSFPFLHCRRGTMGM